jgi:hypothetical protein
LRARRPGPDAGIPMRGIRSFGTKRTSDNCDYPGRIRGVVEGARRSAPNSRTRAPHQQVLRPPVEGGRAGVVAAPSFIARKPADRAPFRWRRLKADDASLTQIELSAVAHLAFDKPSGAEPTLRPAGDDRCGQLPNSILRPAPLGS